MNVQRVVTKSALTQFLDFIVNVSRKTRFYLLSTMKLVLTSQTRAYFLKPTLVIQTPIVYIIT